MSEEGDKDGHVATKPVEQDNGDEVATAPTTEGQGQPSKKSIGTIKCFLCGGTQIYPGPRYESHLINEHGAIYDFDFLISVSLYKRDHGHVPKLDKLDSDVKKSQDNAKPSAASTVVTSDCGIQTDTSSGCDNCNAAPDLDNKNTDSNGISVKDFLAQEEVFDDDEYDDEDDENMDDEYDEDDEMVRLVMAETEEEEEEEDDVMGENKGLAKAWVCPICPRVYKRHAYFKTHACTAHEIAQADIEMMTPVSMTEEEFLRRQDAAEKAEQDELKRDVKVGNNTLSFMVDKSKRKPIGKEWAPNSFSSTFPCYFCNEQFRKDYRLKLHLMLNHKNEDPGEMQKAKEILTKAKLDGCVHRCALCGSKYNSVANFTRHIKDVHQITRAQYRVDYGSSEVVSRMFKCELCDKEVKHTRNIIGAHMKMVHLISWKEYQEILIKLRQGETVGDLPAPELFECIICGVSVKYKREHLNKKHQITEDVYDELIAKKNRGEDISDVLPDREIFKCLICDRECMDIKKHIERSHQITEDMYEDMVASKAGDSKRVVKQMSKDESPTGMAFPGQVRVPKRITSFGAAVKHSSTPVSINSRTELPSTDSGCSSSGTASPNMFSALASSSTDLQCYFGCDESFKKDYQLHLHLKLKHRNEDPDELAKAYEAAEEEIALTRRSASIFNCALCPKTFNDNGAFYGHIQTKHNMVWRDYKEQYGRCEVESAPFECKICGRVVKYDRNTVHTHLKNVHGINWAVYLDRIRKMRRGEVPDDLPTPETFECRVCNVSVKYLKEHLKNAHKITEQEYDSLFLNGEDQDSNDQKADKQPLPPPPLDIPYLVHDPNLPKPPKSDIQDKTNKTCSSCTITFDSRRSFIEHCTTVHNMRFKTKSGATISGPSVQKRLQEEAMRRKAEAERQTQQTLKRKAEIEQQQQQHVLPKLQKHHPPPPPLKRANVVKGGAFHLEEPTFQSSSGRRMLYTPSGVSKWNQCKYECCFCKRTTMSRSSMTSHIHNTHGIPIKEYKESSYPDIEVETNWFQCRLCPARTKFVKDCIAPHLKMSHNMDIETYERDIMQSEDWPYEVVPEPSLRHEMRQPVSQTTLRHGRGGQSIPTANISPVAIQPTLGGRKGSSDVAQQDSERDKWNRCKFACGLCDLITVDSRQMRLHIATVHGLAMESYTRQYGTTEVTTKKFRCELCQSEMKFCRQNVYAHMKDVHKMTLVQYEAHVGVSANDILAVEDTPMDDMNDENDEILLEGVDPTVVPAPQCGVDFVDTGLLDDGKKPSRWNKCRFRCALCGKLSSEKRHVREHIIKLHGLSLAEYEAQYGDCEIHTEYFFCGVCHAEVKHNLKNISLHLQNVHNMNAAEYEVQYGIVPEEEEEAQYQMEENSADGLEDEANFGFGGHFLTNLSEGGHEDGMESDIHMDQSPRTPRPNVPNPPKQDILNPRNKYCRPCGREFNRRQAFVEHCRNVHTMKIRFAKAVTGNATINTKTFSGQQFQRAPAPATHSNNTQGYPCQYCGKVFSNQSNRRRHAVLSCEQARAAGVEPRRSKDPSKNAATQQNKKMEESQNLKSEPLMSEDFYYENGLPGSRPQPSEPQKCPFPGCDVTHVRSALMKRHLYEAHSIQNISVQLPDLETEKKRVNNKSPMKIKTEPGTEDQQASSTDDERKVPPLRVKLSQVRSDNSESEDQPALDESPSKCTKGTVTVCTSCNVFKTNNLYILGRHRKSCERKMEIAKEQEQAEDLQGEEAMEDNDEEGEDEEEQFAEAVEVPVDFEQGNEELDEDQGEDLEENNLIINDELDNNVDDDEAVNEEEEEEQDNLQDEITLTNGDLENTTESVLKQEETAAS